MVLFCKDIANNVAVLQRNVIFLKNSFLHTHTHAQTCQHVHTHNEI